MKILARPGDNAQNPYVRRLYGGLRAAGAEVEGFRPWSALRRRRPDAFLVQWPETVFDHSLVAGLAVGLGLVLSAALLRRRGCRIVWMAHNLQSHERRFPRAEDFFWRRFTGMVDITAALSRAGLEAARSRHPSLADKPGLVVPHGHYRGRYPDAVDRTEARRRHDLPESARVVLFLGRILSYKNVPSLVKAFREGALPTDRLWIVGRPRDESLGREILEASRGDDRIRTEFGFVPDDLLQDWFRASDLCVLPFREILNSGSAILSLSFDLPVLVPERGAMAELRDNVGSDWVRTYNGELDGAKLRTTLDWACDPAKRKAHAPLDRLDWDSIGRTFVRQLLDQIPPA